jgi:hypothetical protein
VIKVLVVNYTFHDSTITRPNVEDDKAFTKGPRGTRQQVACGFFVLIGRFPKHLPGDEIFGPWRCCAGWFHK